jgi:ribosome-associated toxin RatA of RatAB toxin-antitoxin module
MLYVCVFNQEVGMLDCCFSVKNEYSRFIIYLIIAVTAFWGLNSEAKAVLQNDAARLERGEIITKSLTPQLKGNLKGAEAQVLIQSPPEKVWSVLDDQERLAKIIPKFKKIKVLEKTENSQKVYTALKVCPFLPTFKYTLFLDQSEKYRRVKYNKIDGCFSKLYGTWELEPYKGNTILKYRVFFDLGFYVPSFIRSNSLYKDLPEVMSAIKNETESN